MKVLNELKESNHRKNDLWYPLQNIYFYLTAGCNLACRHCWVNPKLQNEKNIYPSLSLELFESILEQAKPLGLIAVKLTGGEPLMHPQIHEILRMINERNLILTIETNGVLCTPQLAEEIAACKNSFVSVSLDGQHAETHEYIRGVKGCFLAAITGIKNLVNAGIKPQIIMTIMRCNKNQVAGLVRLAELLDAGSIKIGIANPTGRGDSLNTTGELLTIEELLILGQWIWGTVAPSSKLGICYALPVAYQSLSYIYKNNLNERSTCGFRNMIGVLSDGSFSLCGIGEHVPELVFGNASKDRLEDVWENNEILKELREDIHSQFKGICGKCHLKRSCSAYCIAQNYYRTGNFKGPYWFCEEAHKKGLFPKSRIVPGVICNSA